MSNHGVHRLAASEADQTFALARLGYKDLTLDVWRKAAGAAAVMKPDHGGVLIAWDRNRQARGLLVYSRVPAVVGAPVLQIERLVAFDLLDPDETGKALIEAALRHPGEAADRVSLVQAVDTRILPDRVLSSETSVLHRIV